MSQTSAYIIPRPDRMGLMYDLYANAYVGN